MISELDRLGDSLLFFLQQQHVLGPFLMLIIEEAGFPIPIADAVLTYAGYQISRGMISFAGAYTLLLIADLIGVSILYLLSQRYGQRLVTSMGKYIDMDVNKLQKAEDRFKAYGPWFIIFGRHIPGMRVPITIFSGMSEITYKTFILSTFLSVVLWIPFYLSLGMKLGPRTVHLFHEHTKFAGVLIMLTIVGYIGVFIYLKKRTKTHE